MTENPRTRGLKPLPQHAAERRIPYSRIYQSVLRGLCRAERFGERWWASDEDVSAWIAREQ